MAGFLTTRFFVSINRTKQASVEGAYSIFGNDAYWECILIAELVKRIITIF